MTVAGHDEIIRIAQQIEKRRITAAIMAQAHSPEISVKVLALLVDRLLDRVTRIETEIGLRL